MIKSKKAQANVIAAKKSVNILVSMVNRNIKNQYRNSVLGILWTVLNPLLNMLVMALVFSQIFGRELSDNMDYPVYVLAGNTVFNLMRMATSSSLPTIVDNYDLLTKTRVPHFVFPVSHVLSATVNFFFSMIALIAVMLVRIPNGVTFHWSMLMVLFPFLPSIMLFSLGLSFILCTIYVRFRDIKHIYGVVLTLWTYVTPLFYPVSILQKREWLYNILQFNPMLHYVEYFRNVVMLGTIPDWKEHLIIYGVGIGFFLIGYFIFRKCKHNFIIYI